MPCVILKTPLEKDDIYDRLQACSETERHTVWNFLEFYEDARVGAHIYTKGNSKHLKGYWENGSRGHTGHLNSLKMWFYIFFSKAKNQTVVYAIIFPPPLLIAFLLISVCMMIMDALVFKKMTAIIGILMIVLFLVLFSKGIMEDIKGIKKWLRKQVEP